VGKHDGGGTEVLHEIGHGAEETYFESLQVFKGFNRFLAPEIRVAHAVASEVLDAPLVQSLGNQIVEPPVMEEFVELVVGPGDKGRHVGGGDPSHGDGSPEEQGTRVGDLDHIRLEGFVHFSVVHQFTGIVKADFQPAAGHLLHSFNKRLDDGFNREGPRGVVALELPVENIRRRGLLNAADKQNAEKYRRCNSNRSQFPMFHQSTSFRFSDPAPSSFSENISPPCLSGRT
jgi:hypothetical protein